MKLDIYEKIKGLAIELVNSSANENTQEYWSYYHQLERICLENENSGNDHPFQWESLGDFTTNNEEALKLYAKALELAQSQNLEEYLASIYFAIAERYSELGNKKSALNMARITGVRITGVRYKLNELDPKYRETGELWEDSGIKKA